MNFEDELRKALRREEPSPGFAARVVARAEGSRRRPDPIWRGGWRMAWAAGLAAMLMVGLVVNSEYRQRRAERAAEQAVLALRITAEKLNFARAKVVRPAVAEQERGN